jgi:hypothetical protein
MSEINRSSGYIILAVAVMSSIFPCAIMDQTAAESRGIKLK